MIGQDNGVIWGEPLVFCTCHLAGEDHAHSQAKKQQNAPQQEVGVGGERDRDRLSAKIDAGAQISSDGMGGGFVGGCLHKIVSKLRAARVVSRGRAGVYGV